MTKKQSEEIKNFLMYLHFRVLAGSNKLSAQNLAIMTSVEAINPQFMEIKEENEKIFKWLDEEEKK